MTIEHVSKDVVAQRRARIQSFATLMDAKFAIPGTKQTFGIDPIIGLVPGAGSVLSLLLSTGIVVQAARYGARRWTLALMLTNLTLDATIGSIPFIGTLFDVFYKANKRNVALIDRHVVDPYQTNSQIRSHVVWSLIAVAVIALILLVVVTALSIWLISWIW